MIIDWNVPIIEAEVDKIAWAESDPRMDGYAKWKCKKDLYELYWYIEAKLAKCSAYEPETRLLEQRRENLIINKLEGNTSEN